jgi:NAD(P)-dependent dehydrogenase (short-subunit alcohol dehydrogenase family)
VRASEKNLPGTTDDVIAGSAVLVTGGGTGIGKACAAWLAANGAAVTICGRTEATLSAAADEIGKVAAGGGSVQYSIADTTNEDDVLRVVEETAKQGPVLGCVANAGGGGGMAPYGKLETSEFIRVLHVNALSTFLCLKHTLPRMIERGGGSFVAISSIAGQITHPFFGAYGPGKAALEETVRNAADEYGSTGVRCNAVRPGFISTEIMSHIPRDSSIYDSYIQNTPLGCVGEPEDVAELVGFLLSAKSRWITGQVFNVDGGHSLRRGPDFSEFAPPLR